MAALDDYLALDLLTLRAHTEAAGDQLDPAEQAARLREALALGEVVEVRQGALLQAYSMLRPQDGYWLVTAFNTHPAHRNGGVLRALLQQLWLRVQALGIQELRSHVYHSNTRSLAFHRKLGFVPGRQNARGVELILPVARLREHALLAGLHPHSP